MQFIKFMCPDCKNVINGVITIQLVKDHLVLEVSVLVIHKNVSISRCHRVCKKCLLKQKELFFKVYMKWKF